ncbi:MAG: hypothetical protein C5B47_08195 [Verrucomicrobia bacterium]|nr:MAG: hypothetical protein C5B47_08195 [Verrucomicrobiota bacterium]
MKLWHIFRKCHEVVAFLIGSLASILGMHAFSPSNMERRIEASEAVAWRGLLNRSPSKHFLV